MVAVVALACILTWEQASQEYDVIPLPELELATKINNNGQVAGSISKDLRSIACIWENGKVRLLPVVSGEKLSALGAMKEHRDGWADVYSSAYAVNTKGQVVGMYGRKSDQSHPSIPCVWSDSTLLDIEDTPWPPKNVDGNHTSLYAINDLGVAVGSGRGTDYAMCPIMVDTQKKTFWFLSEELRYQGVAVDINNKNQVLVNAHWKPYIWEAGQFYKMSDEFWSLYPASINDHGVAVGKGDTGGTGRSWAWIWKDKRMQVLDAFEGGQFGSKSEANDINNLGVVAGASTYTEGGRKACLWVDGKPVDLTEKVPLLKDSFQSMAISINDKGWILVEHKFMEYVLLKPKPKRDKSVYRRISEVPELCLRYLQKPPG